MRRLILSVRTCLGSLNRAVIATAAPFGVLATNPWLRISWALAVFGLLYLLIVYAPPPVPMIAVSVGLWGVFAVSRAWSDNENLRNRIAKRIEPLEKLHELPDLAMLFTVVALQLIFLLPLFCRELHREATLFQADSSVHFGNWFLFVVEKTYLRTLPELASLTGFQVKHIDYAARAEQYVLLGLRGLFYIVLFQGLYRLFSIWGDISDAIQATKNDPSMAVHLGKRAVGPLLWRFQAPDATVSEKANIALALSELKDPRAFETLHEAIDTDMPVELLEKVTEALAELRLPDAVTALDKVLNRQDSLHQQYAAAALGRLASPRQEALSAVQRQATEALVKKLSSIRRSDRDPGQNVIKTVVDSIGKLLENKRTEPLGVDAVTLILDSPSLLRHTYLRVRNRAATTLGRIGDLRAVRPLARMLVSNVNPKLLDAGSRALGRVASNLDENDSDRQLAVDTLMRGFQESENDSVKVAVGRGLARLKHTEALGPLSDMLVKAVRTERSGLVKELRDVFELFGRDAQNAAEAIIAREEVLRDLRVIKDNEIPLEDRRRALDRIGPPIAEAILPELRGLLGEPSVPAELQQHLQAAIERIEGTTESEGTQPNEESQT